MSRRRKKEHLELLEERDAAEEGAEGEGCMADELQEARAGLVACLRGGA